MRVLICDDHSLFAQALAVVLVGCGHEVVGCVSSPEDAVATVAWNPVDVCVMDLQFPGASGIDGVTGVLSIAPHVRVVVLTGCTDSDELAHAIDAGARGLAVKGDDIHRVIDTLERVHNGELVFNAPSVSVSAGAKLHAMDSNPLTRFLTSREREVLTRLVAGQNTAELARDMGVRYSTARTHIQNMLTKMGVHSKLEAVAYAVTHRVVEVPSSQASAVSRPA